MFLLWLLFWCLCHIMRTMLSWIRGGIGLEGIFGAWCIIYCVASLWMWRAQNWWEAFFTLEFINVFESRLSVAKEWLWMLILFSMYPFSEFTFFLAFGTLMWMSIATCIENFYIRLSVRTHKLSNFTLFMNHLPDKLSLLLAWWHTYKL